MISTIRDQKLHEKIYGKIPKVRYLTDKLSIYLDTKGYLYHRKSSGAIDFKSWIVACEEAVIQRSLGYYARAYAAGTRIKDSPEYYVFKKENNG